MKKNISDVTWIDNKLPSEIYWWLKEGHVGNSIRFKMYISKSDKKMWFKDLKTNYKEEIKSTESGYSISQNILNQERVIRKHGANTSLKSIENRIKKLLKKLN